MTAHPLDDPVRHALFGPHEQFAIGDDRARRYRPDIGPFAALDDAEDPQSWQALSAFVAPSDRLVLPRADALTPPAGWDVVDRLQGSQFIAPADLDAPDSGGIVSLTAADADDMVALTGLTKPGPFGSGTAELGGFVGIRNQGELVAMAGRRFDLPGWTEISAVCTHPDHRGQGLSRRLITVVAAGIHRDGNEAFLHVVHSNVGAIRLYRSMGFTHRADVVFNAVSPSAR